MAARVHCFLKPHQMEKRQEEGYMFVADLDKRKSSEAPE